MKNPEKPKRKSPTANPTKAQTTRTPFASKYLPPMIIADLVSHHMGNKEHTLAEAAEALDVHVPKVSVGKRVVQLPNEILSLFLTPLAITDYRARQLFKLVKKVGLPTMIERANKFVDHSVDRRPKTIIAALSGEIIFEKRRAGANAPRSANTASPSKGALPCEIAHMFFEGVQAEVWSNITACARARNLPRELVRQAIAIEALPTDIKRRISDYQSLTFPIGRSLLRLEAEFGLAELLQRARAIEGCSPTRSAKNVLDELAGKNVAPYDDINVRITRGRGNSFLKIESGNPALLMKYRRELQKIVRDALFQRLRPSEFIEIENMLRAKRINLTQVKR